jgi:predicted NAD/FAD-binding protein
MPRANPRLAWGGLTGGIEEYDWNNTLMWSFEYTNNTVCLHHDLKVLPNGNILLIAWEYKSKEAVLQAGRDPNKWNSELWPDHR